jgi:hypothetical protein
MLFTMMHSDVIRIQLYVPQDEAFKQPILQVDIEIGHSGQHPRCLPSVEFAPSGTRLSLQLNLRMVDLSSLLMSVSPASCSPRS